MYEIFIQVGLRDFSPDDNNTFIMVNDLSPQTAELIDQEISRLLTESYGRAKEILTKHKVSEMQPHSFLDDIIDGKISYRMNFLL